MVSTEASADLVVAFRLIRELARGREATPIATAMPLAAAAANVDEDRLWEELLTGPAGIEVMEIAAGDPTTPTVHLDALVDLSIRLGLCLITKPAAANPTLSHVARWALAESHDPEVRRAVADAPLTDLAVLQLLARDEDPEIRRAVATHRSADESIFRRLANDRDPDVRAGVAFRGDRVSAEVLGRLAGDEHEAVRAAVAQATSDRKLLSRLSRDHDSDVRQEVAGNLSTALDDLERLTDDLDTLVARSARQHL